ncbi:MAG: hypothetical protein WEB58_05850, partial [Planctomycetaceae bacterium]
KTFFSAQRANSLLNDVVAFELPALQASGIFGNRSQGLRPWLDELLALWAGRLKTGSSTRDL